MKYENEQNIQFSYQVKNKINPKEAEIQKLMKKDELEMKKLINSRNKALKEKPRQLIFWKYIQVNNKEDTHTHTHTHTK